MKPIVLSRMRIRKGKPPSDIQFYVVLTHTCWIFDLGWHTLEDRGQENGNVEDRLDELVVYKDLHAIHI